MTSKIPGPPCGWTDILDNATSKRLKEDLDKGLSYYPLRPSASGQCSRKLTMDLMEYRGYQKFLRTPMEPNVDRLLKLGHSVEYSLLKQFDQVEGLNQRYKQQTLSFFEVERGDGQPPERIEGSCDVVFQTTKYGGIGDVKSKKDNWSAAYKSKWDEEIEKYASMDSVEQVTPSCLYIDDLPKFLKELGETFVIDNYYQLNLYACNQFIKERGVDHAFLLYYNKNDSRVLEIRFRPSEEIFNQTKAKFNKVSLDADARQIPEECDFTVGSPKFAFCDCHNMLPYFDGDPKKEWFKTFPKKRWPQDIDQLEASDELKQLFDSYEDLSLKKEELDRVESNISKLLAKQKVTKVRLENGHIYDLKFLKSPRPHYELRRGKL